MKNQKLSVVIPLYNEEGVVSTLYGRLADALEKVPMRAEIIFVDDGSEDSTAGRLKEVAAADRRATVVELSRNFGLSAAVTAGLDRSAGDAVVLMDGDLQDPPRLIPALLEKWREGYDVVNATKDGRPEGLFRRLAFRGFYSVFRLLTDVDLPHGCGLFSLMDRRVVRELRAAREQHRFLPGLRRWVGFRQCSVSFDRDARYDRRPRQSLGRLMRLAADAIFAFSSRPLIIALWLGFAIAALCAMGIAAIFYIKLFTDMAIPGWASNMVTTLFMGAVQLIMLGIIGQYIGRIYNEIKGRPLYIVKEVTKGAGREPEHAAGTDKAARAT